MLDKKSTEQTSGLEPSDRLKIKIIWWLLVAALTAAGGSTIAVVKWLRDGAVKDYQFKQLLEHDADHEHRLQRLERRRLDSSEPSGIGSGP